MISRSKAKNAPIYCNVNLGVNFVEGAPPV